ncbi:MAG: PHP domain-containing protein [Anaerolineaceae bacterium]
MGLADLHIHTIHSYDGTSSVSAVLKHVADHTNLDVIAITDHDSMAGVPEALDLAPAYGIEVIPGSEVSTADGHLLALFIERPIQAGLPLLETIRLVGEQGGVCIAAHPLAKGTSSLNFQTIHHALYQAGINRILVGVEAFNGGLVYTRSNPLVEALALALPLAQVGNSDSHVLKTIGQGASEFEGHTALDLRNALEKHATKVIKGKGLDGLGVIRSYIPHYLLRKLGWVVFNSHPEAPITYARMGRAMNHSFGVSA